MPDPVCLVDEAVIDGLTEHGRDDRMADEPVLHRQADGKLDLPRHR